MNAGDETLRFEGHGHPDGRCDGMYVLFGNGAHHDDAQNKDRYRQTGTIGTDTEGFSKTGLS